MKVEFITQSIKIEIDQEIVDECLNGANKPEILKMVSSSFKEQFPYMEKMDKTFFDAIVENLMQDPSTFVSVTSLRFQKMLKNYQRKYNLKLRSAHTTE